ncbi:hypothetical protein [Jannaschia marina]|uniref:hypothetical protein n=1 Tax=Jannaschia marina TaxID=2741674 RepID=UPI0015CA435D|nr:hypothetical protein [Jannaschia marina]
MNDDDLDRLLRAARDDEAPLGDGLRARLLDDATRATTARPSARRSPWSWIGGALGVPTAAVLGLWLGLAQADVVLSYVPLTDGTLAATETELLDGVFGTVWMEGDTG